MSNTKIGVGEIINTKYVGPKQRLFNKVCFARQTDNPLTVEVKFHDADTGMSKDWHPMPRRDIEYWAEKV